MAMARLEQSLAQLGSDADTGPDHSRIGHGPGHFQGRQMIETPPLDGHPDLDGVKSGRRLSIRRGIFELLLSKRLMELVGEEGLLEPFFVPRKRVRNPTSQADHG